MTDARVERLQKMEEKQLDPKLSQSELTDIEKKKQKNLEKMFKYQSKTKRSFKQREPIDHDHYKPIVSKKQKTSDE